MFYASLKLARCTAAVAVFLLCMLFLILKAYMQCIWEMIAILFSIKPFFYEGSWVGWTLILNLFTNICAGKGEQCSGRAYDAYTPYFSPLFRKMWKQGSCTMNKRCLCIPGAWHGSRLLRGSRGLAVRRWEAHRPPSQHKKVASAQTSTGSLGRILWRVMEKLQFRGLIIAVYKSRDMCNVFRRWALPSEVFLGSALLNPSEWEVWRLRKVSHLFYHLKLVPGGLGDLRSSSFLALQRLNHLLTDTEQPTRAVMRAGICLLPLNLLSWLYYLQLVLPQPWLLYSVEMPWKSFRMKNCKE